ncbi:MAG: diguanylate cyclase [Deltaproteobacteria bacterium]|nr:diguanylate cyclase [Deltaproteobacteria bacterium]
MVNSKHAILIVDDEKENLLALKRTLHSLAEIHLAQSGREALSILKDHPISIIITDQRMPEMSGVQLLKKVYKSFPDVMRIILTGYTDIEDLIEAINTAHIYRYLTKPWNNEELIFIVKQAMERYELKTENIYLTENLQKQNEKLQEKEQELKKINKFLEKKIEERTHDLKRLNNKLSQLAITDELTGIGNHRFFQTSFEREINRAKRYGRDLSLLIIDVDHFKIYNDQNGHPKGDKVLKTIAQILSKNVREEDIVTRYGGEEFAIITPETNEIKAGELAERIRKAVEQYQFPHAHVLPEGTLTISIGVATFPKDGKTMKSLFNKADKALYVSKKQGRNQISLWEIPKKKAKK